MSKIIAITIVVLSALSWFGAVVLADVSEWSNQLAETALVTGLAGIIFSLVQLARRRRLPAVIGVAPALVAYFTYFAGEGVRDRISATGFRIATNVQVGYRSKCQLVRIPGEGHEAAVGLCDVIPRRGGGSTKIIYDSSGEFMRDPERRSRDWRWAVRDLPSGKYLANSIANRRHLVGEYYEVFVPETEEQG